MKTKNLSLLLATLLGASLTACNSGAGSPTNSQNLTNATQVIPKSEQGSALKTFQSLAVADKTQVGKFEKIGADNEFKTIDMNNLDDITTIYIIGDYKLNQYSVDGTWISEFISKSPWLGAYQLTRDEISHIGNQISPTVAIRDLLNKCANVFSKDDVVLYSYGYSIPTETARTSTYMFNFKMLSDTGAKRCFQSLYAIDSGEVSCVSIRDVSCNLQK